MSAGQLSPKTLALHRCQLRKLAAAAGDFPAADLRAYHLVGVDLSNHFVRTLKALFKWASDDDVTLVPRNPFRKLATPPTGRRERTVSPAEFRRFLVACPRHYRRFFWLALHTAMRPGELRGLTWDQIDPAERCVVLTSFKAKRQRRDGLQRRHVPLTVAAANWLAREHRRRGGRPGLVFLDRRGKPLTPNGVRCVVRRARAKAGLEPVAGGERLVMYTLRHTAATERVRRGMPINVLAVQMGHTNTQMTQRYQHLKPADLVAALDRVR